jgi:hypothetical protein
MIGRSHDDSISVGDHILHIDPDVKATLHYFSSLPKTGQSLPLPGQGIMLYEIRNNQLYKHVQLPLVFDILIVAANGDLILLI